MSKAAALSCAAAMLMWSAGATAAAAQAPGRIEARSDDLLAVGLVRDDRMSIHLTRLIDNAPVRDATITVVLRGVVHPTVAETDGSFTLQSKELALPGAAAVEFQIAQASAQETLKGMLQSTAGPSQPQDKNSARQLWWWVLNFTVCIGFLMLLSRRRKAAAAKERAGD